MFMMIEIKDSKNELPKYKMKTKCKIDYLLICIHSHLGTRATHKKRKKNLRRYMAFRSRRKNGNRTRERNLTLRWVFRRSWHTLRSALHQRNKLPECFHLLCSTLQILLNKFKHFYLKNP